MPRKRYKAEEFVAKLRQVDVLVSQGQVMADAIRQIGVSEEKRLSSAPGT
jgi:putative transposase